MRYSTLRKCFYAVATPIIFGHLACSELPTISFNTCGNGVVEATNGENCEYPTVNCVQCRLVCTPNIKRTPLGGSYIDCPQKLGYGCGIDGFCRQAQGTFDTATVVRIDVPGYRLDRGDFDGDGRDDLLMSATSSIIGKSKTRVAFFNANTSSFDTKTLPSLMTSPSIGRLKENAFRKSHEIVFITGDGEGVGVFLGDASRGFAPEAYAQIPLQKGATAWLTTLHGAIPDRYIVPASGEMRVAVVRTPRLDSPGKFDAFLAFARARLNALAVDTTLLDAVVAKLPIGLLDTASVRNLEVATGQLVKDTPCEEVVFSVHGGKELYLVAPCTPAGVPKFGSLKTADTAKPILTFKNSVISLRLADLDGDGNLDVLAVLDGKSPFPGELGKAYYSFGDGRGNFTAEQPYPCPIPPRGTSALSPEHLLQCYTPIAWGDTLADGSRILVFPKTIAKVRSQRVEGVLELRSDADGQILNLGSTWTTAFVTDFNADGALDVVAASNTDTGVDLYSGVKGSPGTLYNPSHIETEGLVSSIRIADLDGDRVDDFALHELRPSGPLVSIAYGRPYGPPDPPIPVGSFPQIAQIETARLSTNTVASLSVVYSSGDPEGIVNADRIALLYGEGNRLLMSPFGLSNVLDSGRVVQGRPEFLTIGQFESFAGVVPGFVAVAVDQQFDPDTPAIRPHRLWVGGYDGRDFVAATPSEAAVPAGLSYSAGALSSIGLVLAGDLDGGRIGKGGSLGDEVVYIAPTPAGVKISQFSVKPLEDPLELRSSRIFVERSGVLDGIPLSPQSKAELIDLDGDGYLDLVLQVSGLEYKPSRLFVFWNDKGRLNLDAPTNPIPDETSVRNFATLTTASGSKLVIATAARLVSLTLTKRAVAFSPDTNLDAIHSLVCAGFPEKTACIQTMTTGDFNGDGLSDLAVSSGTSTHVFFGRTTLAETMPPPVGLSR